MDGSVEIVISRTGNDANQMADTVNLRVRDNRSEQTIDERLGNANFSRFEGRH